MVKDNLFYKRLKLAVTKSGKSFNQVEKELGYSRNALSNYKKGIEPSGNRLIEVSQYFNVTPDYLMGKTNSLEKETPEEIFRKLNDKERFEMVLLCQKWFLTER